MERGIAESILAAAEATCRELVGIKPENLYLGSILTANGYPGDTGGLKESKALRRMELKVKVKGIIPIQSDLSLRN